MSLDICEGIELIKQAYQSEIEDKVWQQYLFGTVLMTNENYISFEDYKRKVIKCDDSKTYNKDEILADAEITRKLLLEEGG